jgi:OOP family OmpA-OmpF porin
MKKKFILRGVNFDFDKSNIRADARPVLDEAISTLKDEADIRVSVEGHTDSRGTDECNRTLVAAPTACRSPEAGINSSRLEEGLRESKPVASNDTDDGRAQRRAQHHSVIGKVDAGAALPPLSFQTNGFSSDLNRPLLHR